MESNALPLTDASRLDPVGWLEKLLEDTSEKSSELALGDSAVGVPRQLAFPVIWIAGHRQSGLCVAEMSFVELSLSLFACKHTQLNVSPDSAVLNAARNSPTHLKSYFS